MKTRKCNHKEPILLENVAFLRTYGAQSLSNLSHLRKFRAIGCLQRIALHTDLAKKLSGLNMVCVIQCQSSFVTQKGKIISKVVYLPRGAFQNISWLPNSNGYRSNNSEFRVARLV